MIKIYHLTSVHRVDDDRIYIRECSSLAKVDNYDVYICGPGNDSKLENVTVVDCGQKERSVKKRILNYDRKLIRKALDGNADIYHLHDPELLLYARRLKETGAIVIYDSHEDYSEQIKTKRYIPSAIRTSIAVIYKLFESHIFKIIDGAIFPCLVEGKDIFENRVKHHTLINNVPVPEEIPKEESNRSTLGKYVCCAGGLTRERGIEQLIDACYIAGTRLVLAGSFEDEDLENSLRKKESFSIVDYRGVCNRTQVMDIYKKAGMGASTILPVGQYPKIWNLPTKVYEFMMYGLPFVISDFEYSKKVINKYHCGVIVDSTDPEDIAKGIRYIMNNQEEALEMGRSGTQAVRDEFNWSIEERKLFKFYSELLGD